MSKLLFSARHRFNSGFQLDVAWDTDAPVTALFGPSGAGKSTILQALCGVLRVDEGHIEFGGQVWLDTKQRKFVPPQQRRIGMVFQDQLLFPHRSVEGNLRYGLRRYRGSRPLVEWDETIDMLELRPLLSRRPATLSGGERQRTALARALLSQPQLLLLDEPVTSLDDRLRWQTLDYLERVIERWQIPTLYVSHAQAEVRRLAERAIVVEAGRVVIAGGLNQALLHRAPLQWRDRMGPTNLLRLTHVQSHGGERSAQLGSLDVSVPPPPVTDLSAKSAAAQEPNADVLWAQLDPRDVMLATAEATLEVSARNRWPGAICQIIEINEGLMVAVDVGQIVWAEVTRSSAQEQQLAPGKQVVCVVKTYSLRVME